MPWRERLREGGVIPVSPVALTPAGKLDERRQRALARYYIAAGAAGLAVGLDSAPGGMREAVLEIAACELRGEDAVAVAGIAAPAADALRQAEFAAKLGYQAALLSMTPDGASGAELFERATAVAAVLPVFGCGRGVPYRLWRRVLEIPGLVAIRTGTCPHDSLAAARALADSGRAGEVALYTGNEAGFLADLLATRRFAGVSMRMAGGLLRHWSIWTLRAVRLAEQVRDAVESDKPFAQSWLTLGAEIADANAAIFDAANGFRGRDAGIREVLRRQGLLESAGEDISPGHQEEVDRVTRAYPHLADDDFVRRHLDGWLR